MASTPRRRAVLDSVAGPVGLAALFEFLTITSWQRWADVQIDFGRELQVAWALASGKTLYVDVFDKNGPLPHLVNALWFELFGPSVRVLALCNLALLALFAAFVYETCRRLTDRFTATLCAATALVVFGFAQYLPIGNYNFVTPYNHHQTHGLMLGAAGVAALDGWLRSGRARFAGVAGACLGLVFLTKAELFVPAAAACGVAWLAALFDADPTPKPRRAFLPFALGALLPPFVFVGGLATQMPLPVAIDGVLGNWRHLGEGPLADPFYRAGMGLDRPLENLGGMLGVALVLLLSVLAAAGAVRLASRGRRFGLAPSIAAGVFLFVLLVVLLGRGPALPALEAARVLPLVCAGAVLGGAWRWLGSPIDAPARARARALVLWGTYAGALLAKLGLHPRFFHYGFSLSLVATVLTVALLVGVAPRWLRRNDGRGGTLFRALAAGAVVALLFSLAEVSQARFARRTLAVGEGADAILVEAAATDPRGETMARGLARLRDLLPPGASLAVLPEGAFLNDWLRAPTPTPYLLLTPQEIAAAGGEEIVAARFRATPPDVIVLLERDGREFGMPPFGQDSRWGKSLVDWIHRSYDPIETIGAAPFTNTGFGLTILRHNPNAQTKEP